MGAYVPVGTILLTPYILIFISKFINLIKIEKKITTFKHAIHINTKHKLQFKNLSPFPAPNTYNVFFFH